MNSLVSERGYHNMSRSASFKYGITSTRLSRYNSDFHKHYHYRNVNLSKELCKTRCNDLLKHANINEIHHIRHKWRVQWDPLYSPHILNALWQLMSWSSLQEPVSTLIKGHYGAFWMLTPFDYVIPDSFVTNNVPSCLRSQSCWRLNPVRGFSKDTWWGL